MPSFDIVSRVDLQELDNAVNMARKEVANRYDFRGSRTELELDRKAAKIRLLTEDNMKLRAVREILLSKAVKRGIDPKAFEFGEPEKAAGDMLRQEIAVATGLDEDTAKRIAKTVKSSKLKVQAQIQGDEVRVTGKKRDELQEVIQLLKEEEFGVPLQFVNYRD
ncbi:MAG: YajQ family cyclic di-GMP-binding protein [Thermoleophilia bacterium]